MTKSIFKIQDQALALVFKRLLPNYPDSEIILGGGTALARFYLHHRVSYDLDFFLSSAFDPVVLAKRLGEIGLPVDVRGVESKGTYATQLHGLLSTPGGDVIRVSFVEDIFAGMFKSVEFQGVLTEEIDGLYHRKLRTVSGTGSVLSQSGRELGQGHRQTARDLYDLYVLDLKQEPIDQFVDRINKDGARFPVEIFRQNLSAIPWMDLIDEFEMLEPIAPFQRIGAMDMKRKFDDVLKRITL
ncbi:MAG: nucleotidyl transferase AbiEii/AbiGii toxin family protein [Desulfobulbaceae bacterium]|nr:nucleotidyl transferase AbiEii/AbiGii toxin family protein [Desulfobulbaceae bacterium]